MAKLKRDSVVEAAKAVALQTGGTVSRSDFIRLSGISGYYLYRLFPDGGWSEVQRLAGIDPQQARIVELRFFAGLSIEETAEIVGVSPATVKRDWVTAKAYLFRELTRAPIT